MSEGYRRNRSHWPLVALSLVPAVLGVLLPLILVRVVSPAEVGIFKVFFLYLGVAPALLLTSGVRSGLAYWAGQETKRAPAMQVSSSLLLLVALTGTAIALSLNSQISGKLSISSRDGYLFAISLLGAIAGCYFEEAAIALGRVWTGALFYCGSEVLRTIAIISALFYDQSVSAVLVAHTAASTLKLVAGYWYGYKLGIVGFSLNPSILKDVWRYALPVSFAYVFGIFIGSADQFLLANRITPQEFALYSIGCLSIAPLLTFEQSVTRVLIPQMSEAFSKQQPQRAAALYQSAVDNLAFILLPAVTGLLVFSTPIIELFFTRRYSEAAKYLQIFGLSYPLAGPVGALTGVLLSGLTMRLYSVRNFQKELSLRFRDFIPFKTFLQYALICLALGGIAVLMEPSFTTNRAWLLGSGGLFSVSYLCLALPLKNRAERRRLGDRGVLILSQSLHVGGLERMILHLSRHLKAENEWKVYVLAYDHSDAKQALLGHFAQAKVPVEVFQKKPGFSFGVIGRLLRTIYKNDITVIHSQDLGTLIYAVMAKLFSFGRVSIVHTQHSFPPQESELRYRMYRWLFSHGIDQLGVVSEDVRSAYSQLGLRKKQIHLIENGVDFASQPIEDRSEKRSIRSSLLQTLPVIQRQRIEPFLNDLWILYQARFSPGKGQEHALRLWRDMEPTERHRSIMCFVGPESVLGEYDRIRALIEECPNKERIFILGASTTPLEWLKAGDLFLSCSEYEGMPLAPLEAAGSGLPLLLSRIPGHSFLQNIGLDFSLDDIQQGAQQIKVLLQRIRSGGECYQRELWENSQCIRERFSVARMAQHYSTLYSMSTR